MASRTFRVFVSSTFSDLVEERNALSRWVFPKLRALCEKRGYRFHAVDLRWGVRDEAAADQRTVRICLDEIVRCQMFSPKPNFIVLLGDKYGWRPPPSLIAGDEMDRLRPYLTQEADLIFGCKDAGAEADDVAKTGWYRLDENAVPPEWVLQPRRGVYEEYEIWERVERRMCEAIAHAAEVAGVSEEKRQLHGASATELEIVQGTLEVSDARDHVFAFVRSIANKDAVIKALPTKAAADLLDLRDGAWDQGAWAARERLQAMLLAQLGADNVWSYTAEWRDGQLHRDAVGAPPPGTTAEANDIELKPGTFCYEVFERLAGVIERQMGDLDKQDSDNVAVEQSAQADFAKERTRVFVGRTEPLDKIAEYLEAGAPRPLVVYGESGSGKSALMARAADLARTAHPEAVVVQRFLGAVLGASEACRLLESLCRELGCEEGALDGRYDTLVSEFHKRLAMARGDRPVMLFLDSLDQLGELNTGRLLHWLPSELPPHVRIVVSTLPDEHYECMSVLRARAKTEDLIELAKLSVEDGGKVLDAWLQGLRAHRQLTAAQRGAVLEHFRPSGLPLYLKLAFEEACLWHSYDSAPEGGLPPDVPGLIRGLYARLSRQHGELVVSRTLGFLAAAHHGLSGDEVLALLWRDKDVRKDFDENKHHELLETDAALPPIVWSRLYFDLQPYLAHREVLGTGLLAFYHRQLCEVAKQDYLGAGERKAALHGQLADYFLTYWEVQDTHALLELVPQLAAAARDAEILELLFNFHWLEKKLVLSLHHAHAVEQDCRFLLQSTAFPLSEEDNAYLEFLREIVAPLRSPEQLATILWGHFAGTSYLPLRSLLNQASERAPRPWLRPIIPSLSTAKSGLIRSIDHAGHVTSLAIGDTESGSPIIAIITEWSPARVRIWIGDIPIQDVAVPDSNSVLALNLPGDMKPALLHSWKDVSGGTHCRLLDLSTVSLDACARLHATLNFVSIATGSPQHVRTIGSKMAVGEGTPKGIGILSGPENAEDQLVLIVQLPMVRPFVRSCGEKQLTVPALILEGVDRSIVSEFMHLVSLRFSRSEIATEYVDRVERLAESLSSALGEQITVEPREILPERVAIWDVATGNVIPDYVWSIPRDSSPALIGQGINMLPFLIVTDELNGVSVLRLGSADVVRLAWIRFITSPVLSRRLGRPVIVKGGLAGLEVVDASTFESLGAFSAHSGEETLLATVSGAQGVPLVASVGSLGSRGRLSTSVRIWDLETLTQIAPAGISHTDEIKALTSGYYRGNPAFATASCDLICLWRTEAVPDYSSANELGSAPDPNDCGRVPLTELPRNYRQHDLGAVCALLVPRDRPQMKRIATWAAQHSDFDSLTPTHQDWDLQLPDDNGRRLGTWLRAGSDRRTGYVESVWMSGNNSLDSVIETTRRDGTHRRWRFSRRADWERQCSDWHYWHCVSVSGALANGTRFAMQVRLYGEFTLWIGNDSPGSRLTYDPGCPVSQCALSEDRQSIVVFDERGIAHHLELVLPPTPA